MKIIDKIREKLNSKFLQNVIKMMTGTVIGQLVSIVLVPVASRIYGATFYGDLAVFTSMSSLILGFLGFGLGSAIMVADTDHEAMGIYKIAVWGTSFIALLLIIVSFIIPVEFYHTSLSYHLSCLFICLYIMMVNAANMSYAWINRQGKFDVLLVNPILGTSINNGLIIILGTAGFKEYGLYVGLLISQLFVLIHMYRNWGNVSYRYNFSFFKMLLRKYSDFILYQYPASIANEIVGQIPIQILSRYFGNTIVGYYSMSMRLINIPSNLISGSFSRVYFKETADIAKEGGNGRAYTLSICKKLMSLFAIPTIGIMFLGDYLIPIILGVDWVNSVVYLKIMMVWNLFAISINSTSGFTSIIHRQKVNMIFALIKLIIFPISMISISYIFKVPELTVLFYTIVYSIINVLFYNIIMNEDQNLHNKYVNFALKILLVLIVFLILKSIAFK